MNPPAVPERPPVEMPTAAPLQSVTVSPTQSPLPPSPKNKKVLFSILGIIILTITTISGFFLIAKPILYKSNAWNCGAYTFSLSETGVVSVHNGSSNNEPLQRARVYINNQLVQTFDVPALATGGSATLGTVQVPTTTFSWQIQGTSDCSNAGNIEVETVSYQCQNIRAYTSDGTAQLSATDLSNLKQGDTIRIVAKGSGVSTNYNAAKFSINGVVQAETNTKMTSGDYFMSYTIPSGITSFSITAQLKGADGNWY